MTKQETLSFHNNLFPHGLLNESTCQFDPPTPCPDLTGWYWDEDNTTWVAWDS